MLIYGSFFFSIPHTWINLIKPIYDYIFWGVYLNRKCFVLKSECKFHYSDFYRKSKHESANELDLARISEQNMFFSGKFPNMLSSYFCLIEARMSASEKEQPVTWKTIFLIKIIVNCMTMWNTGPKLTSQQKVLNFVLQFCCHF